MHVRSQCEQPPGPSAPGVLAVPSRNQLSGSHPKGLRDALDVGQGWVALAALDATNVGPVEARQVGERLLGEAALSADLPHSSSEQNG